jgi:sugar transferase EpsL
MKGQLLKRGFDLALTIPGVVVTAPLLAGLSFAVARKMGRPVLHVAERPGRRGETFRLYKFRSMTDDRDAEGQLLSDEQRLTSFGRFLRSTSLDELPELLNVLKGDMSLVGPRPLLARYLSRYSEEQARRHELRPGITGWAQVNGRNALSWAEKFKLDVWYVDNRSLWLDVQILWATVAKVLKREDIVAEGSATMPEFTGNEEEG